MNLIYQGKTKDVYSFGTGQVLLKFKDDVTGTDGVFDPGANTVGLSIEGAGKSGLKMTKYFFELLHTKGISTHFISADLEEVSMVVKEATTFGKGLEVICRFRAVGSFYRRYGAYCAEGQVLKAPLVEVTLKDDGRGDPVVSKETLALLDVLPEEDYLKIEELTKKICLVVKEDFAAKGLDLYDIKLEFGRDKSTNEIMLIDEISGGNMRVYKDGQYLVPLELEKVFLG